jgi:cytochrome c556
MTRRWRWTMAAAAAALCGCVSMAESDPLPAEALPTPQQIVAARQAAYHLSGAMMGQMKATIDRGGDVKGLAYGARGVARWARALPTLFPDSTRGITPSRARPEIWDNRADFEAKAVAYAEAASRLAAVAESGDREAFAAQFDVTRATCQACHERYQVPLNPVR